MCERSLARLLVVCPFLLMACQQAEFSGNGQDSAATTVTVVDSGPSQVELASAIAKLDGNVVKFEVNYEFTSGAPVKTYLCEFKFPGTANHGMKPMDSWEMKSKGVIKAGFEVSDPAQLTGYEIVLTEAESPDAGYSPISNTLTGEFMSPESPQAAVSPPKQD